MQAKSLPWSCTRWVACTLRRGWRTGCHNMEHSKRFLLLEHISCHGETAGRNDSLCGCWSSCWGPPRALQKMEKSCNSVHDHLLAQIPSNAALPVEVSQAFPGHLQCTWFLNAGFYYNKMVVFNNIYWELYYLHDGEQEGCFSLF